MNNFELIDDYLSNRLRGAEKEAFDKQLAIDPTLKSELDFQTQIVQGIRSARASELKSMLNKVPVGGTGVTMDFSVVRMAAGLITAGVVGAAVYFYVTRGELPPFEKAGADFGGKTEQLKKDEPVKSEENKTTPDQNTPESTTPVTTPDSESKKDKKELKKTEKVKPAEKPKLDIVDPSEQLENNDNTKSEPAASRRSDITPSHIQVEMDSSNKKYNFHYQFVSSKLMLYGSFDRSLYEVLEINGDNHAVFLFYKDVYYLLNENQDKITKLEPIKDSNLVNKLREYRKK